MKMEDELSNIFMVPSSVLIFQTYSLFQYNLVTIPFPVQNEMSVFQRRNKNNQNGTSSIKNDISIFNNGISNLTVEN